MFFCVALCIFFKIVRPSKPANSATSSNLLNLKRFAVLYSGRFAIQNVQDSLQGNQGAYAVTARGKQYFS